jgi:hypothetical protein
MFPPPFPTEGMGSITIEKAENLPLLKFEVHPEPFTRRPVNYFQ